MLAMSDNCNCSFQVLMMVLPLLLLLVLPKLINSQDPETQKVQKSNVLN